jgi:hypothetical protein
VSTFEQIAGPFVYVDVATVLEPLNALKSTKADLTWEASTDGAWAFGVRPRSHFHAFCSLKGNHAGFRSDGEGLKFFYDRLPDELRRIVDATYPRAGAPESYEAN